MADWILTCAQCGTHTSELIESTLHGPLCPQCAHRQNEHDEPGYGLAPNEVGAASRRHPESHLDIRRCALDAAVMAAGPLSYEGPDDVVDAARIFETYLRGWRRWLTS